MLGQLESQCLLPLVPVGLLQRVQLEPSSLCRLLVQDSAGLIDQTVDQEHIRAADPHLYKVDRRHVTGYGDVGLDAGGGRVGGGGRASVAGTGQRHLGQPKLLRLRDGGGQPARLEAPGRVLALILDAKSSGTEAKPGRGAVTDIQQGRHSLAERHDIRRVSDRQELPIAPHVPRPAAQILWRDGAAQGRQIVAGEQHLAAPRADAVGGRGIELTATGRTLEAFEVARPAVDHLPDPIGRWPPRGTRAIRRERLSGNARPGPRKRFPNRPPGL